jgi:transposase
MPAPYSPDLRHRVLAACKAHQTTFAKIAQQYTVSEATLHNWRKAEREEGRREAKPHAGGPARKLGEADEAVLAKLVEEQNDSTLEEYVASLHERTGKRVSDSTMSVVLRRLRLPRKKNAARQ